MHLQFKAAEAELKMGNIAVMLFEDGQKNLSDRPELDAFKATIEPILQGGEFKASYLAELPVRMENGAWLMLIGLGHKSKATHAKILEAAASASKLAAARNSTAYVLALPPIAGVESRQVLELCAIGAVLGLYKQTAFKSKPESGSKLKSVTFLGMGGGWNAEDAEATLAFAGVAAKATKLARALTDEPGNILYPETFIDRIKNLAEPLQLKTTFWDEKDLAKESMNLILAVGSGSARPPRLALVEYQGAPADQKPIALVGKGVTFDSGGISLKPAANMEIMKSDMAGAAIVLAVILATAELKLPVNLIAIMPLAENMPDGAACRPGDVFKTRSGATVEITNTDAEGRLILAEALTLAKEQNPAEIIDIATLTGACAVALGEGCGGLFANRGQLRHRLMDAAEAAAERFWPLPLIDEYEESLKSETADFANASSVPKGGAINAALFLRKFIDSEIPWAHLDVAGPARASRGKPSTPVGGTGIGVRTLLKYFENAQK